MKSEPLPLCAYCSSRPIRPGDLYCCDGCKVLAEVTGGSRPSTENIEIPDDAPLVQSFGRPSGETVRFECHVDPLACEACLQGLVRLEQLVPGLRDLQWNRNESVLSFEFAKGGERPSKVFAFLQSLNLSPRWKSENDEVRNEQRRRVLRLGVTAALAGNLMLFSVPIYAGLAGSLQDAFEIVQLFLFLPVLFWAAQPIYRTAWTSLRLRHLSVDLPLTVAFLAGSLFSIFSVLSGRHDIYFDSLAGFLFLILWSRSLLEGSLAHYLETPSLERFFEKPVFSVTRDSTALKVLWSDLREGDELTLATGDRTPVDGTLLSPSAEVETAWMTGEKTPLWRLKGSQVQAGSRLVSKSAVLRALGPAKDTEFARLLGQLRTRGEKIRPSFEARLGNALVLTCFASIALLFIFGSSLGLEEVFRRSVSLLIVACPCAVSFAAPLARAKANRLALKRGFWIRDSLVWTKLTHVRKIAFDKTGTLTGGFFTLAPHSPMIDPLWKQIILSLENISRHPVAESLRRSWGPQRLFEMAETREIPGVGVEGRLTGALYQLRSGQDAVGHLHLELIRDGRKMVDVLLQDDVSPNTEAALKRLHQQYDLYIVSGDRRERVEDFGRRYGFNEKRLFGGMDPDAKVRALDLIEPDVYFGDGTNDLPAMKKAPVSIAVSAASLEAQAASDIIMFEGNLGRAEELFKIARATRALNHRNFLIALTYNLVAGTAALAGFITPLGAAILMPLASFALLGSTLRGTATLRRLENPS